MSENQNEEKIFYMKDNSKEGTGNVFMMTVSKFVDMIEIEMLKGMNISSDYKLINLEIYDQSCPLRYSNVFNNRSHSNYNGIVLSSSILPEIKQREFFKPIYGAMKELIKANEYIEKKSSDGSWDDYENAYRQVAKKRKKLISKINKVIDSGELVKASGSENDIRLLRYKEELSKSSTVLKDKIKTARAEIARLESLKASFSQLVERKDQVDKELENVNQKIDKNHNLEKFTRGQG